MKSKFLLIPLMFLATGAACASPLILPDSCGSDKVNFDVTTQKNQPAPKGPADGKAQIVFVYTFSAPIMGGSTTRFGVDGTWAGAASQNSYFVVDVAPGDHTICSSVQSRAFWSSGARKRMIGIAPFTAEAGKTYYFEFVFSGVVAGGKVPITSTALNQLNDLEGQFRVKSTNVATSTPQK